MVHVLFLIALLPAALLAHTVSPSATVLNQLLSIAGWGVLLVMAPVPASARGGLRSPLWLAAPLLAYALAGVFSWLFIGLPTSMAWPSIATALAALAVALSAAQSSSEGRDDTAVQAFCLALLVIGCFNVAIALIQVFTPDAADGLFVAHSGLVGRAVGNLRQPNHLSSLALWSAVAVVPLVENGRLARWMGAILFAAFIFSVELSASRTGMVGVAVLALWGALDGKLAKPTRAMLLGGVLVYAIGWAFMSWWATASHHTFGAAARLGESDISGSRYGIWSNTWALIRQFPLLGVGFGEFNFAWTLTPFPGRPTAFFDHTHNVLLQLLVELGLPLGGLVIGLLGIALWKAFVGAFAAEGVRAAGLRSAFVMVLLMALHSQLEYPLWYAYFLLPTAWAWGYCLGAAEPSHGPSTIWRSLVVVAGCFMVAGAAWAFREYLAVSRIFEPGSDSRPLGERIEQGRRTVFFAYHADYAAVTVAERPSEAWPSFATAPHYLLDTRLMMAWATAFAERGDLDRARYIAQRLKEFNKPDAAEFFAPCDRQPAPKPLPFQCEAPQRKVDWREFRDPALYR